MLGGELFLSKTTKSAKDNPLAPFILGADFYLNKRVSKGGGARLSKHEI